MRATSDGPRYRIECRITSDHDDEMVVIVRRNAKAFYIRVLPSSFVNSPVMRKEYFSYLEVIRSGEEFIGDIFEADIYEWLMPPFAPFLSELAPSPNLTGNPADIKVTVANYLKPQFFIFTMDVVDEQLRPRRVEMDRKTWPYRSMGVLLGEDALDDLETWTTLYDPAGIILNPKDPEDALFKPPAKVLINSTQTTCFFKPCRSASQTWTELQAYKKINAANFDSQVYISRLYGVVLDDGGFVVGILLTYIDHQPLSTIIDPDRPFGWPRERWMGQIENALTKLHNIGVIWGDVKAENVLIDSDGNAWATDFNGGFTKGWVDKDLAGTVEGDLMGLVKLKDFIFQPGWDG